MTGIPQLLHEQEAATQAERAATKLKRFFRRSCERGVATLTEAARADADWKRAGAELERALANPQAELELIACLRAEYQRTSAAMRAHYKAMAADADERRRMIAVILDDAPDNHPAIPMLVQLLRAAGQLARSARRNLELLDDHDRVMRERNAKRDKLRAKLKAAEKAPPHERLLVLTAIQEERRTLRRQWDAEDQRLRQKYLGHRTPRLRLTSSTTTTTVRALPRVAARRPGCRARRTHRAAARAPASASGSSDGDGRPPPPPPPPIDTQTLLAGLLAKLRRSTGRLLAQQIAAEPQQTLKETHRGPSARGVAETITIWPGRIAERLHQQQGERP